MVQYLGGRHESVGSGIPVKCPYCGHNDSRVIDSRETETKAGGSIRRRRECGACGKRYTTYERLEHAGLTVVKKDGRRQDYDRAKLLRSVAVACTKRPIPKEAVDTLVDEVDAALFRQGGPEISSRAIGALVMERLRGLDDIAYIRFASVYLSFPSLRELREAIERIEHR
jgi:transcriptional repressor NrdR